MIKFGVNGEDRTLIEAGDVIPGAYQVGPTFSGPTTDAGIRIKAIEGKSVQAVSTGKQLFDQSKVASKTQNGLTFTNNGDGTFTIAGESLTGIAAFQSAHFTHDETVALLKEGTLYFSCESSNPEMEIYLNTSDGIKVISPGGSRQITASLLNDPNFYIYYFLYGASGSAITPKKLKPMLYQDGDGSWEPFTGKKAGPQPEYPISIRSYLANKFASNADPTPVSIKSLFWLRSLPDGTHDEYKDGKIIRRIGEIAFDGSSDESWTQDYTAGTINRYLIAVPGADTTGLRTIVSCNRGFYNPNTDESGNSVGSSFSHSGKIYYYPENDITTIDQFKTWLTTHPLTVLYKLATPTTEDAPIVPVLPSSAPSTQAWSDSSLAPMITWEALPAGSCAREVQELRKRIEELEKESVNDA